MINKKINGADLPPLLQQFEDLMVEYAETGDAALEARLIELHARIIKFSGTCPPCVLARKDLVKAFSDIRSGEVLEGLLKIRNATKKVAFKMGRVKAAFGL